MFKINYTESLSMNYSIQGVLFAALLFSVPVKGDYDFFSSPKINKIHKFCSKNSGALCFATITAIPFILWEIQRYQEHCKPIEQFIEDAQTVLKNAECSFFLKDFETIKNKENFTKAIDEIVTHYCTAEELPFVTYASDLEDVIGSINWKVQAIEKRSEGLTSFADLYKNLRHIKNELTELLKLVKNHKEYCFQILAD